MVIGPSRGINLARWPRTSDSDIAGRDKASLTCASSSSRRKISATSPEPRSAPSALQPVSITFRVEAAVVVFVNVHPSGKPL